MVLDDLNLLNVDEVKDPASRDQKRKRASK